MNLVLETYQVLMVQQMDVEHLESMRLSDGRGVSTWEEPYAQIKDKAAFNKWCWEEPDLKEKMSLASQTINKLTKDRLAAGEEPPPGIEVVAITKTRLG